LRVLEKDIVADVKWGFMSSSVFSDESFSGFPQNDLRLHDMRRWNSNYVQVNDRKERGLRWGWVGGKWERVGAKVGMGFQRWNSSHGIRKGGPYPPTRKRGRSKCHVPELPSPSL